MYWMRSATAIVSLESGNLGACCTDQDHHNAILYEHSVINQAAAAAGPQGVAPPWFQGAINQLRADIRADIRGDIVPDLKRLLNKSRGDGATVPCEVVLFPNGQDPTAAPHNLPRLTSLNVVYTLNAVELNDYLNGYAVGPIPGAGNPYATDQRRKAALMRKIAA